jgi:hypothetical protein
MKFITKSLLGAGAAAAALVSVAAPAQARDRYDRNRDGISAGEIIAGAVVLGGLTAVLSAGNNDRYYEGGNYNNRTGYYNNRAGNSRAAINQCINTVERSANGYSRSEVTQIRNIERTRYGYRVTGNIVVQDGQRGRDSSYGYGNDRYDQGDRYNRYDQGDRYNRNAYGRGYDKGRFTCFVEQGRVVDVNYKGLDQWR